MTKSCYTLSERLAWLLFLIWSAVGVIVMPWNPGPADVATLVQDGAARNVALAFLRTADAIWILFAAVVTYFWMIRHDGLSAARVQALIVLAGSGVIEWIGHTTGWPFGPYKYTENFGPRLGGVLPLSIPLAWLIIVVNTAALFRYTPLAKSRLLLALAVGAAATLVDFNLEPVAWHVREYWIWYPDNPAPPPLPPWQNYASWFVVAAVLTALLPALRARPPEGAWKGPLTVLALVNGLVGLSHLVHVLRGS